MDCSTSFAKTAKEISLSSSLYDGIEENDLRQIVYLLEIKAASPNLLLPDKGISPLHRAVGCEKEPFASNATRLLLLHGGDPNVRSVDGATPVHVAAAWGQIAVLELLLSSGGDPGLRDGEGHTPLDYAQRENQLEAAQLLRVALDDMEDSQQVNLKFEKVLVDEGDLVTEYLVHSVKEIQSSSTQMDQDGTEEIVASGPSEPPFLPAAVSPTKSYDRVAKWCEEQCQLVSSLETLDLSSSAEQGWGDEGESKLPRSEHASSTSETFFTCASQVPSAKRSELYRYTDERYGVVLLEKRLTVSSTSSIAEISDSELGEPQKTNLPISSAEDSSASSSDAITVSDNGYCTDRLRRELTAWGSSPPGPITSSTKRVYLRYLARLQRNKKKATQPNVKSTKYSRELERTLRDLETIDLSLGQSLEERMIQAFTHPPPGRQWREGVTKSCFTYLLLDPRVSRNLPLRASSLPPAEVWRTFLQSIFYVGKGQRSRPYSHLYEAVHLWNSKDDKRNQKVDHIHQIWEEDHGVVCLHVFQNIIPVEAYTREAAMIDALGVSNLCNQKRGEYYGAVAGEPLERRRWLGVFLLYHALNILLHEGERQLQPPDIS